MNLKRILPPAMINRLRQGRHRLRFYRDKMFAVDKAVFKQALHDVGIQPGQIVYVRSSYDDMRSILASPIEIINMLSETVGDAGTLVMPTYPMSGRSQDYLDKHSAFDVRRTASLSGLLTEIFRRMPGTERSLNPTHPLAARGAAARWLTEGHEHSEVPFDEHSPYQKLLERNAGILSIGRFDRMPLHHLIDHLMQDRIPYSIYSDRTKKIRVIGRDRKEYRIQTKGHNPYLVCDHRVVLTQMMREKTMRIVKAGRVPLFFTYIKLFREAYQQCYEQGLFRHSLLAEQDPVRSPG